jgi:hypothetical protein
MCVNSSMTQARHSRLLHVSRAGAVLSVLLVASIVPAGALRAVPSSGTVHQPAAAGRFTARRTAAATPRDTRGLRKAARREWRKATRGTSCADTFHFRGGQVARHDKRYGFAAINDNVCLYNVGWYFRRSDAHTETWKVALAAPDSGQQCSYYTPLPNVVLHDFYLLGNYADGAWGPCWEPRGRFRTYSTARLHGSGWINVIKARPRKIEVDSADGGELRINWHHWSRRSGEGSGTANPDHGSFPMKVKAMWPAKGVFTRLNVRIKMSGVWHGEKLILGYMNGEPHALSWLDASWLYNSASGYSPWPAS